MSSNPRHPPLPPLAWRLLGVAAVALLGLAVLAITLISAGLFDPQPAGPLHETLMPGVQTVEPHSRSITWLPQPAPQSPYTVRLEAMLLDGERDSAYGLVLGSEENALFIAVSPSGYVAIWQELDNERLTHLPWQTWPHIRSGNESNEIQLDRHSDAISVRLNRELLWQGPLSTPSLPSSARLGLYGETFGAQATVDFATLTLFYEDNP